MQVQETERAAGEEAREHETTAVVGKSIPRVDGVEKVSGRAEYTVDISLPGMLHGKVKHSDYPHAEILSVDTTRALKVPGVMAVVTAADVPDVLFGSVLSDTPLLARKKVRYVGEPIAAVAAQTIQAAEEAAELVKVTYRELPAVFDPEEALRPECKVVLHPEVGRYVAAEYVTTNRPRERPNVCLLGKVRSGDIAKAFREPGIVTVENRFTTSAVQHVPMEPICCVARSEANGDVTVWSSHQSPFRLRKDLSTALQLPESKIRIIVPYIGGGYGNKLTMLIEGIAVALARKAGRPVKMVLTREENFSSTQVRHPFVITIKDGVRGDSGRIVARQITAVLNGGAYSAGGGITVGRGTMFSALCTYDIQNISVDSYRVYTNQVPAGAFRGYGGTQMDWAIESQMDLIAAAVSLDPLRVRVANFIRKGGATAIGESIDLDHEALLRRVTETIGWDDARPSEVGVLPDGVPGGEGSGGSWKMGRGVAIEAKFSTAPGAVAYVRLREDESIDIYASPLEIGQGSHTAMIQIACEVLGMRPEKATIVRPDTSLSSFNPGAFSSRQTFSVGNAIFAACQDLRRKVLKRASEVFGCKPDELRIRDGRIMHEARGEVKSIGYAEIFKRWEGSRGGQFLYGSLIDEGELIGTASYNLVLDKMDPVTGQVAGGRANSFYTPAACACEVAVNVETGHVRVLRCVVACDVGRAINPSLVESQLIGSAYMGLSTSMFEEVVIEEGRVLNSDFANYTVGRAADMPKFEVCIVESHQSDGPYAARGAGESAVPAIAPAIGNAIRDAVGVSVYDLPITSERVLAAINGFSRTKAS